MKSVPRMNALLVGILLATTALLFGCSPQGESGSGGEHRAATEFERGPH